MELRNLQRAIYSPTINENGWFFVSKDNYLAERVVNYIWQLKHPLKIAI